MSAQETPAAAGPGTNSHRARRARGGPKAAHDDDEPSKQNIAVYVLSRSVVISAPDHTRVENPDRGITDYCESLPPGTKAALREVAYGY